MRIQFSLIICTYRRAQPLIDLLNSVKLQTTYPDEILVIDGSQDDETKELLKKNVFNNLKYFKVDDLNRGLTKQRNYGISLVDKSSDIICFLDDDTILKEEYFEILVSTYKIYPEALAVGGYIIDETEWINTDINIKKNRFLFDGWSRTEPLRFRARKWFGLSPDAGPGWLPTFGHGRSIAFLPPSGKIYEVEQIMGGVSSYRRTVFEKLQFSSYFQGYGLYEDADFSIRLAKLGKIYVNTGAQLYHYHQESGRPNKFKYGKMVIRNGWYVWRIKYPNPSIKARIKWNLTALLLTKIRFINILNTNKRVEAFTEGLGRVVGWFNLALNRPKTEK